MDKLQLVVEYTRNMLRAGHCPGDIDTSQLYDLVNKIEEQGVDRGIILSPVCDLCREKVSFIDTSTQGTLSFTAHCTCRRGRGRSKILAIRDWRMQKGMN